MENSYDAENAVLSILICNPELAFEVTSLKTEMFSSIAHKQLYGHIQSLVSNGSIPDRMMVESRIRDYPQFSDQSDFNFLQYILSQHYPLENFQEYLRIVSTSYKTREIIKLSKGLPALAKSNPSIDDVIENVKNQLEIISDVTGGEGTSSLSDLIPGVAKEIEHRKDHPNQISWSTGFTNLNLLTGGYKPGNVMIIASRPSVGKTAWLCNSVLRASESGVRCLVFEHEMNKQDLADRLLATYCGIPLIRIRTGNLTDTEYVKISTALDYFRTLPIYLDTTFGSDINYLKATTRKFVKTHGVQVVFADYIQLMVERTDNMTMELGNVSRELKILATKLEIQLVVLSQLNRNLESRIDKKPTLSDLRQSGNLEEDADLVGMLYRDDVYNGSKSTIVPLEYIVRKHRNGPIGLLPMTMNLETNSIEGDMK